VFCAWALVGFLCILFVYLEAYCAFLINTILLTYQKKNYWSYALTMLYVFLVGQGWEAGCEYCIFHGEG
jgi:hypothetical protein